MTSKVASSSKALLLRRLVAEQRRLLQEKAALETMLKNLQILRNKVKLEQVQLTSHVRAELGQDNEQVSEMSFSVDPFDIVEEEANIATNKPSLNLDVNHFNTMFFNHGGDEEMEEDDDSEDEVGCAGEVLGNPAENELMFENF